MDNASGNDNKHGPMADAVASAAEERIRAVLEALPSGVVAAEAASGHIVYANGAMGRMLGCRLGELLGMTLFDIHPTVDEPRIIAQFEKALRGESNHVTDVPVMRNDGHVFPADVHHTFVEIRRRQCLLGIYTDATERTRAKDALQASETQLRTILSNVNDVVWSMSYPDWMPIYVSASVETLSGLHREELVRSPGLWLEMIHPEDRPLLEQMKKDLEERGYAYRESRIVRADGSVRWMADRCKLAFDDNGQACRVDGVATDITGRKRAEEALRESENKLRSIFQAMTDVIFVMDENGRYVEIAPTQTDLMIRPPRELIGRTVDEVVPAESAALCLKAIRTALDTGVTVPVDYQLEIQGRPVWFAGMVSRMSERTVVWVARDITQRKQVEDSLRKGLAEAGGLRDDGSARNA